MVPANGWGIYEDWIKKNGIFKTKQEKLKFFNCNAKNLNPQNLGVEGIFVDFNVWLMLHPGQIGASLLGHLLR